MDFKIIFITMWTLMLAELGDKTMFAVIAGVSKTKKPLEIFIGASLGLIVVTLAGVLLGSLITRYIPKEIMEKIAASIFILIGILIFTGKI